MTEVLDWIDCDIRLAMVANADACSDLRAADPATCDEFRALLGPPARGLEWDLAHAYSYANGVTHGVSTCGLVAAGLLRRVIDLSAWDAPYREWAHPYHGLDVVSALGELGLACDARRVAGDRPQPGDVVCIGEGLATHVMTAIAWDGGTLVSVDGGQVDEPSDDPRGLQRTRTCRRGWSRLSIVWVLDLDRLAATLPRASWTVPDGADIKRR